MLVEVPGSAVKATGQVNMLELNKKRDRLGRTKTRNEKNPSRLSCTTTHLRLTPCYFFFSLPGCVPRNHRVCDFRFYRLDVRLMPCRFLRTGEEEGEKDEEEEEGKEEEEEDEELLEKEEASGGREENAFSAASGSRCLSSSPISCMAWRWESCFVLKRPSTALILAKATSPSSSGSDGA